MTLLVSYFSNVPLAFQNVSSACPVFAHHPAGLPTPPPTMPGVAGAQKEIQLLIRLLSCDYQMKYIWRVLSNHFHVSNWGVSGVSHAL